MPTDTQPRNAVAAYWGIDSNWDSDPQTPHRQQWDLVAAAGRAVRLVVADWSYKDLPPGSASANAATQRFENCRRVGQLVFGYVYGAGGKIPLRSPNPNIQAPSMGDQIDAWHNVYGSHVDGIYVDVGPTDCHPETKKNYQDYVAHIRQYGYKVYLLAPAFPDSWPADNDPWMRNLAADPNNDPEDFYIGLWEAGVQPYTNSYQAYPCGNDTNTTVSVPPWWHPGPDLAHCRVVIVNDCRDANTMRSVAQTGISRETWTLWITLGREVVDANGHKTTVYDQLPPYWLEEVALFDKQVTGTLSMVWKGAGNDQGIYHASSADGANWTGQSKVPNIGTSTGAALAKS